MRCSFPVSRLILRYGKNKEGLWRSSSSSSPLLPPLRMGILPLSKDLLARIRRRPITSMVNHAYVADQLLFRIELRCISFLRVTLDTTPSPKGFGLCA